MNLLDLTLAAPVENLACDEALLELCDEEGVETLRFWESPAPFVVVGYANRISSEVNVEECQRRGVPILRRCSGGGTVVQGRGCLNYGLTLRISDRLETATVSSTNQFVMETNRAVLERLLGFKISREGHTDLAFKNQSEHRSAASVDDGSWRKFSGNAQRRRRHALLFHGTILHSFDLRSISDLLPLPSIQPGYRKDREHSDFVSNLPCNPAALKQSLSAAWKANEPGCVPTERIAGLVRERYSTEKWNLKHIGTSAQF